jgi:hypothetical protein
MMSSGAMSHACVGMPETRGKLPRMPTQAWSMAPNTSDNNTSDNNTTDNNTTDTATENQ